MRAGFADEVADGQDNDENQQGDGDIHEILPGQVIVMLPQQVDAVVEVQHDRKHGVTAHKCCETACR